MRGAAPYIGAYCIRPTNGPDRGQVRRKRSRGEAPYVGRIAYAPQTIREDRMIESEYPYLSPFGDKRRPAGSFFSSLDRRKEGKRRSRPLPRPGKMGRMCLIGSVSLCPVQGTR